MSFFYRSPSSRCRPALSTATLRRPFGFGKGLGVLPALLIMIGLTALLPALDSSSSSTSAGHVAKAAQDHEQSQVVQSRPKPRTTTSGSLPAPTNLRFTSYSTYYDTSSGQTLANVGLAWDETGGDNPVFYVTWNPVPAHSPEPGWNPALAYHNYLTDTGVLPNTNICYQVSAQDSTGNSDYSLPLCIEGTVAPPTPQLVVKSYDSPSHTTSLNFYLPGATPVAQAPAGWLIQRSTATTGWTTIATLNDSQAQYYSDTSASVGTLWYYRVVAFNGAGNSPYSASVHAGGLAAPTGLVVNNNQPPNVSLSWQLTNGANTYYVQRSTATTGWTNVGTTTGNANTSFTDTNASGGTLYYYRVWAADSNYYYNQSDYSTVVNTHAVPATPQSLTAQAVATSQVNLTWAAGGSYSGQSFFVERKLGANGTYSQIAQVAATTTTFSDSGVKASNQYYYRVRAGDTLGYSAYSAETAALTFPGAPSGLTATSLNGQAAPAPAQQINLSWQPPTPAGNTPLTGYRVEHRQGANGAYAFAGAVDGNTLNFIDTSANGLVENTAYTYRVRAYNSTGGSAFTSEVTATTAPNAPSNLTATVSNATPSPSSSISLSWTNNSTVPGLSGFKIEQALGSGNSATNWQEIGSVGSSATSFTASVKDGTTYAYRVRAANSAGLYSAYTGPASATTPLVAPTSLVVTSHSFIELDLAWASTSTGASGFKVERKLSATGTYAQIGLASVTTSAATSGSFTFRDVGLTPGQTYFYRVRSTSPYADSAYSTEASNTTPASADLIVTKPSDDGTGQITGTLSYALTQAQSGQSIAIQLPAGSGNAIVVAGGQLPAARTNVTIAGNCGVSGVPGVTLTTKAAPLRRTPRLANTGSTTTSSSGFSISGDVLYGLSLNLTLRTGPGNLLRCVAIHPAG